VLPSFVGDLSAYITDRGVGIREREGWPERSAHLTAAISGLFVPIHSPVNRKAPLAIPPGCALLAGPGQFFGMRYQLCVAVRLHWEVISSCWGPSTIRVFRSIVVFQFLYWSVFSD